MVQEVTAQSVRRFPHVMSERKTLGEIIDFLHKQHYLIIPAEKQRLLALLADQMNVAVPTALVWRANHDKQSLKRLRKIIAQAQTAKDLYLHLWHVVDGATIMTEVSVARALEAAMPPSRETEANDVMWIDTPTFNGVPVTAPNFLLEQD